MIGEMNRRIVIARYESVTDTKGGTTKQLVSESTVWAKVEDRSGMMQTSEQQQTWSYDSKIKVRSRGTKSNDVALYDDDKYLIRSVQIQGEGKKRFEILRCSKTDGKV